MSTDDNARDMLVPPDQGPSAEAAGGEKPASQDPRADDPAQEAESTGTGDGSPSGRGEQAEEPTSGDTRVPGELRGEGNAEGLTQGLDQG